MSFRAHWWRLVWDTFGVEDGYSPNVVCGPLGLYKVKTTSITPPLCSFALMVCSSNGGGADALAQSWQTAQKPPLHCPAQPGNRAALQTPSKKQQKFTSMAPMCDSVVSPLRIWFSPLRGVCHYLELGGCFLLFRNLWGISAFPFLSLWTTHWLLAASHRCGDVLPSSEDCPLLLSHCHRQQGQRSSRRTWALLSAPLLPACQGHDKTGNCPAHQCLPCKLFKKKSNQVLYPVS